MKEIEHQIIEKLLSDITSCENVANMNESICTLGAFLNCIQARLTCMSLEMENTIRLAEMNKMIS